MKRPLIFSGLFVVLIGLAIFWGRHNSESNSNPVNKETIRSDQTESVSLAKASPVRRTEPVSPPHVPNTPVTHDFLSVFDSRDVRTTVNAVLATGNADQKGWAASLVADCGTVLDNPNFISKSTEPVEDMQKSAYEQLKARCSGFEKTTAAERKEIRDQLKSAAKSSTSDYAKLRAMATRASGGDTRRSSDEDDLIMRSMYSEDPVLEYAALGVVISSIDRNVLGSQDLAFALTMVQGQRIDHSHESFLNLMFCASGGACGQPSNAENELSPDAIRLEKAYEAALDAKASPAQILAIR